MKFILKIEFKILDFTKEEKKEAKELLKKEY